MSSLDMTLILEMSGLARLLGFLTISLSMPSILKRTTRYFS